MGEAAVAKHAESEVGEGYAFDPFKLSAWVLYLISIQSLTSPCCTYEKPRSIRHLQRPLLSKCLASSTGRAEYIPEKEGGEKAKSRIREEHGGRTRGPTNEERSKEKYTLSRPSV
jgi:hypothetical protein